MPATAVGPRSGDPSFSLERTPAIRWMNLPGATPLIRHVPLRYAPWTLSGMFGVW